MLVLQFLLAACFLLLLGLYHALNQLTTQNSNILLELSRIAADQAAWSSKTGRVVALLEERQRAEMSMSAHTGISAATGAELVVPAKSSKRARRGVPKPRS